MAAIGGAPSVVDLILFHTTERNLFTRMTTRLGRDSEEMSSVMALWLWLESIGYHDFIRHVYSYDDDVLLRFISEAESCLQALKGQSNVTNHEIPAMSWLMNEPMDLRFFDFNREVAVAGIERIKKGVCNIIFDDDLIGRAARDASHPANRSVMTSGSVVRPFGEGSSVGGQSLNPMRPSSSSVLKLNPMARPWAPPGQSPEDQRSMFITFSKGHPITREDITDFFTSRYGPCIETVMIEKAGTGHRPMYGRVVFTSASMITAVLNGQRTAKFMIKGKHLWARMYVPRNPNT